MELTGQGWQIAPSGGFFAQVGTLWRRQDGERWIYGIQTEATHLNTKGIVHGGMLLTLMDQVVSLHAIAACDQAMMVTLQLDSQFLSAARAGEFIEGEAFVLRRTRSLVFLRGELRVGDRLLVSGQAIMKIIDDINRIRA
jgi:uncharacterized protein (TIGR00369 family)